MSMQQEVQKKRSKKGTKNWYFTPETEQSIVIYNASGDDVEKNKLYNNQIKPAFEKLAENIIHTFKFYYTDGQSIKDVQHEVVSFLIEKLPRYTQESGRAFSYFSIVAKNFLILRNNKNYRKLMEQAQMTDISDESYADQILDSSDDDELIDFIDSLVAYYDNNLQQCFPRKADQQVAMAIVELFRRRENLEIFNKKALYIYIREMTNASTQQITKVVKMIKTKYKSMYVDYDNWGFIPHNKIY